MPRRKKRQLGKHVGVSFLKEEILKYYEDKGVTVIDAFARIAGNNPRMRVVKKDEIGHPDIWEYQPLDDKWVLIKIDKPKHKPPISNASPPSVKLQFLRNSGYYYLEFQNDDLFDGIWTATNDESQYTIPIDDVIKDMTLLRGCDIEIDILKKRIRSSYFLSGVCKTQLYYDMKEIIFPLLDKEKQRGNYSTTVLETIEDVITNYRYGE